MGKRELRNTRKARKGKPSYRLRTKTTGNVNNQVDRLKVDRLKEKTCATTLSFPSSTSTPERLCTFAYFARFVVKIEPIEIDIGRGVWY
jgi:hypothetical protein